MGILFLIFLIGLIPGMIAKNKGHSFFAWWLFGMALFILALPLALLLKPKPRYIEAMQLADGGRKCPFCAEVVKGEAVVCRYCNRDLPPITVAEPRR